MREREIAFSITVRHDCGTLNKPSDVWLPEVGINLKQNYMVRYTFDENQGLSATDFQYVTIGFSTKVKQGILMQLRSVETTDYISVEMNNNGKCTE